MTKLTVCPICRGKTIDPHCMCRGFGYVKASDVEVSYLGGIDMAKFWGLIGFNLLAWAVIIFVIVTIINQ